MELLEQRTARDDLHDPVICEVVGDGNAEDLQQGARAAYLNTRPVTQSWATVELKRLEISIVPGYAFDHLIRYHFAAAQVEIDEERLVTGQDRNSGVVDKRAIRKRENLELKECLAYLGCRVDVAAHACLKRQVSFTCVQRPMRSCSS
jgi:hypothetical protein